MIPFPSIPPFLFPKSEQYSFPTYRSQASPSLLTLIIVWVYDTALSRGSLLKFIFNKLKFNFRNHKLKGMTSASNLQQLRIAGAGVFTAN